MTLGGWIIMIVAVGGVVGFFAWCMTKVLTTRESAKHIHGPVDIDTRDRERD
jgi:hypothetical protein